MTLLQNKMDCQYLSIFDVNLFICSWINNMGFDVAEYYMVLFLRDCAVTVLDKLSDSTCRLEMRLVICILFGPGYKGGFNVELLKVSSNW